MRSLKEYTGKFYIKTAFQDVVALQYKLLCGQVNILMFLFVSSSPWDIPCPVKLLLSLLYTRQKTKLFRLFGTSGCYHPLRLYVVFHTTFVIPPHTYTHLPPTSLSNTWSETLHSIKCLTTKLLVLISHPAAQKLQVLVGVLRNSNWSLSHLHLVSLAWRQMFHLPSFSFLDFFPPP